MPYARIEIKVKHPNACGDLTETEKSEILSDLNSENFPQRIKLSYTESELDEIFSSPNIEDLQQITQPSYIHSYKIPQDLDIDGYSPCHVTARKYAQENPDLEVVSGYIVWQNSNSAELKSHSVVRDINTNILWELMDGFFPARHKFIVRSPNIRGYDLTAH